MSETASDAAAAQARRERHLAKLDLVRRIAIYKSRMESIEDLIEEEQKKLRVLMSVDGESQLQCAEATPKFIPKRTFSVVSTEALIATFTKAQLAEMARPTAEFIDACVKAGVDYKPAVVVGMREDFEVKRAQTHEQRKQQEQIIEETRRQMESTVDALSKRLAKANKDKA